MAADRLDRVRIGHLATDRGGSGGVQPPHPSFDLAGTYQCEAVDREREHLDVDRSHLARERERARRLGPRRIGAVVGERELRADHRHPRGRNVRRRPLNQQRSALNPARGLGRPPKCIRVEAELDRETCSTRGVPARPGQAVTALMRLDRGLRIKLIARRQTRPLERLRRLLLLQRLREPHPRLSPRAARERQTPILDRSTGLVRSRERNHSARPPRATRRHAALNDSDDTHEDSTRDRKCGARARAHTSTQGPRSHSGTGATAVRGRARAPTAIARRARPRRPGGARARATTRSLTSTTAVVCARVGTAPANRPTQERCRARPRACSRLVARARRARRGRRRECP